MVEYITTRTYYSKKLDEETYSELALIAKRLGILRKIIWHQFSSDPKRLNDRKIRDIWLKEKENGTSLYPKIIDQLPARLWKETLRDTIGSINGYFEAGFKEVMKAELKEKIYSAAKVLAQKASIIAIEDLTFKTKSKGKFKKVNRRLSSWIKETEFAGTTLIESPKIEIEFCFTKDASVLGYEKVSNLGLFNKTFQSKGESELKINTEFLNSISGIEKE